VKLLVSGGRKAAGGIRGHRHGIGEGATTKVLLEVLSVALKEGIEICPLRQVLEPYGAGKGPHQRGGVVESSETARTICQTGEKGVDRGKGLEAIQARFTDPGRKGGDQKYSPYWGLRETAL